MKQSITKEQWKKDKASKRRWYNRHKDQPEFKKKRYLAQKKYADKNREKVNQFHTDWRNNEPEKIAQIKSNRYAREKGAEGGHTLKEWKDLVNWLKGRCVCCCEKKKLTKDHIVPLSLNGSDFIDNIQLLCQSCNASKGNKIICYI